MSRTQNIHPQLCRKPEDMANYQRERRKRRRRVIIFCGLAIALAPIVAGFFVGYAPSGGINIQSFDKIEIGMQEREVLAILGPPGNYRSKIAQGEGGEFAVREYDDRPADHRPSKRGYSRVWHRDTASISVDFSNEETVCYKTMYCWPFAQVVWWGQVVAELPWRPRVINDGSAVFVRNGSTGENANLLATIKEMHWRWLPRGEKRLAITFSLAWKPGAKDVKEFYSVHRVKFFFWPSFARKVKAEDLTWRNAMRAAIETPIYLSDEFINRNKKVRTFEQSSTIVVPAKAAYIQMSFPSKPVPLPPR